MSSISTIEYQSVLQFADYRDYLRAELTRRLSKNQRYSLRAFSRDLRVVPQVLSAVLRRKKGISADLAAQLAGRLGLSPFESGHFIDLVQLAHVKSAEARQLVSNRIRARMEGDPDSECAPQSVTYDPLQEDAFRVISDWYHYALLELMCIPGFRGDPAWISVRLGISVQEASRALERMERLGLITRKSNGQIVRNRFHLSADFGGMSHPLRNLARQLLEKATQSIEEQSVDERDLTSMTLAIDPDLLPMAKKKIARFRRELSAFLESGKSKEVYVFAPCLFRVSRPQPTLPGKQKGK